MMTHLTTTMVRPRLQQEITKKQRRWLWLSAAAAVVYIASVTAD